MMRLRWSPESQADLAEIDAFYRPLAFDFAQRVLTMAVAAAEGLLQKPQAGQLVADTAFRKWRVKTTPYSLLYRETDGDLHIVRVVHHAQDWQKSL